MATLEQIAAALAKADAAGNVEDARALANAYRQMQGQGATAPGNADPGFDPMRDLPIPGTEHPTAPDYSYKSMVPGGDTLNAFANAFGQNIPVVGPLATRAADATGSQLAAMITGETPEAMLEQGQGMRAQDAADNQVADAAGTVAGSVGPLMSLGTTKVGEQALGLTGPMLQRMFFGGASGAAITGADSLARGDDLDEAGWKALTGAGIGVASPLVERAVAPFIRMLTGQTAPKAAQTVGRNMERAGIDPADLPALLDDLGPDSMILDLNKNLTRQGGGIASVPGQGGTILDDALTSRQQGTNARIIDDVDSVLGPAPIPSRVAAEIKANQQALSPAYETAFANAAPVDVSSVAARLDGLSNTAVGEIGSAVRNVRSMLTDPQTGALSTDPRRLMSIRQELDDMIGGAQGNLKRILSDVRKSVDDELAAAVPGIKAADQQYAELAQQNKGLETGGLTLSSGRGEVIRPQELDDMLATTTNIVGPSGVPFRISQGARAEIDRIIGTTGNDITALKSALKGDGSWNREKLASLFGKERADRLVSILEREQRYTDSFNRITQNSETAARTVSQREASPAQIEIGWEKLLFGLPQKAANAAARTRSEATNKAIAEMLTGNATPEMIDQLLAARQMNRGLIGSSAAPMLTNQ